MQYRTLGKTSLKVSVLSFGTWLNADDPESIARNKQIVKHAWDLGINFFDTAEGYGGGQAEVQLGTLSLIKSLGVALKELQAEKNVNREDLVVSTKLFMGAHFFKGPNSGESIAPNTRFLSRKHIIEGTKASLERLQLDYVDLLYCHRFDHITPLEETCRAMDWVVRKGYALYWGTSEWTAQQIF
jgi:aryl-alcohol dehydrogenase-like predicted oxidoreductase